LERNIGKWRGSFAAALGFSGTYDLFLYRNRPELSPWPMDQVVHWSTVDLGQGNNESSLELRLAAAQVVGISLRQHGKDEELAGNLTSSKFRQQSGSVGWVVRLDGGGAWSSMGECLGAEEENEVENRCGG
jgi:hypothetical protein